jgi:hypothetical protein
MENYYFNFFLGILNYIFLIIASVTNPESDAAFVLIGTTTTIFILLGFIQKYKPIK